MTLVLRAVTDTASADYAFAERTLTALFPHEEYRDLTEWRDYVAHREAFRLLVAVVDELPMGLLSYWDFGSFLYIEHLGVAPDRQAQGVGTRLLRTFQQTVAQPIILEVELPDDEPTRRRVAFYERLGFRLWAHPYTQPPYRKGDSPIPMRLMGHGWADESRFEEVRNQIYRAVYGGQQV